MTDDVISKRNEERRKAAETVINTVYAGGHVADCLRDLGMHPALFYNVLNSTPELFDAYTRARHFRAELMADEIVQIADTDPDPQRARNRIQARQWRTAKLDPKTFSDRIDINVTQTVDVASALSEARSRILRPVCDQLESDEAETVEFIDVPADGATDTQSEAAGSGPGMAE